MIKPKEHEENPSKDKVNQEFFMGNGIPVRTNKKIAAVELIYRDHIQIAQLNIDYVRGKLGPMFMPEMFFSDIPKVIHFDGKGQTSGFHHWQSRHLASLLIAKAPFPSSVLTAD